jgi:trans-aconitate methyltransferase
MDTKKVSVFLTIFKNDGVSHEPGIGLDHVLTYQDLIGRSNMADIHEYWNSLTQENKRIFTWVNFLTLSQDMAIDILKGTTLANYKEDVQNSFEKQFVKRENDLFNREMILRESKRTIYKRIRRLENELIEKKKQTENLRSKLNKLEKENWELKRVDTKEKMKAAKFDIIREALKFDMIREALNLDKGE